MRRDEKGDRKCQEETEEQKDILHDDVETAKY